jgi:hypothetical protein
MILVGTLNCEYQDDIMARHAAANASQATSGSGVRRRGPSIPHEGFARERAWTWGMGL